MRPTGYLEPERAFRTYSKELTPVDPAREVVQFPDLRGLNVLLKSGSVDMRAFASSSVLVCRIVNRRRPKCLLECVIRVERVRRTIGGQAARGAPAQVGRSSA
jgi:hypothetical protein